MKKKIEDGYYVFYGRTAIVIDGERYSLQFLLKNKGWEMEDLRNFCNDFRVDLTHWSEISFPMHIMALPLNK